MPVHAVLTGQIINSTRLNTAVEKKLLKMLHIIMEPYKFEFYEGDSFQLYMKEPAKSLRVALLCRTAAISFTQTEGIAPCDIKISIGIGTVTTPVRTLRSAKGEAFILSGQAFDELQKTDTRLSITIANNITNTGLQVIADYINAIYSGMTTKQAEVVFALLKGETQQKASEILNKSKSTISQLVNSARWTEIEKLLQHYENLVNPLI